MCFFFNFFTFQKTKILVFRKFEINREIPFEAEDEKFILQNELNYHKNIYPVLFEPHLVAVPKLVQLPQSHINIIQKCLSKIFQGGLLFIA